MFGGFDTRTEISAVIVDDPIAIESVARTGELFSGKQVRSSAIAVSKNPTKVTDFVDMWNELNKPHDQGSQAPAGRVMNPRAYFNAYGSEDLTGAFVPITEVHNIYAKAMAPCARREGSFSVVTTIPIGNKTLGCNPLSSENGWKISEVFNPRTTDRFHKGIDLVPENKKYGREGNDDIGFIAIPSLGGEIPKIYAPADGIVDTVSFDPGGGGYFVKILLNEKLDGKKVQLVFMHLNPKSVNEPLIISSPLKKDDIVTRGTYIADMGGTFGATKPAVPGEKQEIKTNDVHLHFEMRVYEPTTSTWVSVNPLLYFNMRTFSH